MDTTSRLAWGILGTGAIARTFAQGLARSRTGRLAAVGSRSEASARNFAAKEGAARAWGSYEALLADPEVEAVYISTPHPQHAAWCVRAARAGKHILCEKPLTLNRAEAMRVAEIARENGVFLMEAFMYRCHPQTRRLLELVREGAVGQVRLIRAVFSFNAPFDAESRLFKNELGGGGILDVGCYSASVARLVAGAALGRPFAEPVKVKGVAELHPETGVDLYALASLQFPGGILAELGTGVGLGQENGLWVYGSEGSIRVPDIFIPPRQGGDAVMTLTKSGAEPERIVTACPDHLYALEADAVAEALRAGLRESPFMPVADTLGNLAVLDAWRGGAGLVYRSEAPEAAFPTIDGAPLRRRAGASMRYGAVDGVAIPVSRLVFGCDHPRTMPFTAAVLDDFFERGGNALDTAYQYGEGVPERLVGRWMEQRGLRRETALIVKGAHTPFCTPEYLESQLRESLERLRTDYADMYVMHRDNTAVPVGEFVELLNEQYRAGKIRAFGGSNWSLARLREANAYAEKNGLRKFTLVSNNLSLARMVSPVWDGCISAGDAEFRSWLAETGTSLLAWSSQARGFFTERAGRDKRGDAELLRCWYSEDNFARRDRALELARRRGVEPINIALAYVLAQPFPVFALIGPREIRETVSTLGGLAVELSPEECRWLETGA